MFSKAPGVTGPCRRPLSTCFIELNWGGLDCLPGQLLHLIYGPATLCQAQGSMLVAAVPPGSSDPALPVGDKAPQALTPSLLPQSGRSADRLIAVPNPPHPPQRHEHPGLPPKQCSLGRGTGEVGARDRLPPHSPTLSPGMSSAGTTDPHPDTGSEDKACSEISRSTTAHFNSVRTLWVF